MAASSSGVRAGPATARRFSSSCATLLAPISAEVTRWSRSTHDSASCASVWPRPRATSLSARRWPTAASGQQVGRERPGPPGPRSRRDAAVQVSAGQQALGERRERDAADPVPLERVRQAVVFDPAVQDRVRRLVDEQPDAHLHEDRGRLSRLFRPVRRDPGVQRPARLHRRRQRAHHLLERGARVGAMAVEDVDVLQAHPAQRLVQAREQVLARAPVAVRPGHMSQPALVEISSSSRTAAGPRAGCGRS